MKASRKGVPYDWDNAILLRDHEHSTTLDEFGVRRTTASVTLGNS